MLPVLLLPDHLDLLTTMPECVPSNTTGTPKHCSPPAGLDAAPRTTTTAAATELMTQSVKRPSAKRKVSSQGPAATSRADTADHGKRLRLDSDATDAAAVSKDAAQADPASTSDEETKLGSSSPSRQQDPEQHTAQQGEQGEQGEHGEQVGQENEGPGAVASQPHGNCKGMQQGVFSPQFVGSRGQAAAASASAAAATAAATAAAPAAAQMGATESTQPGSAQPAQPENKTPDQTPSKSSAAAPEQGRHHHAHHPPAPAVPEAAESDVDDPAEEDEEEDEFDPLLFIRSLPPLEQCIPKHRRSLLPSKTRQCKRKTLVLDLDETLVHSTLEPSLVQPGGAAASAADFSFEVHFNNMNHTIHVRRRPHLAEFMAAVAAMFEVVVFTASQKVYAEKLLNVIDPKRCLIKHRVFRDSCVVVDGNYLKDLTILGRDMNTTFIVDNSPQAFGFQPDNGIPIESWYDDEEDTELLKLLPFLQSLADDGVEDVRPHIASKYRLKELIMNLGP